MKTLSKNGGEVASSPSTFHAPPLPSPPHTHTNTHAHHTHTHTHQTRVVRSLVIASTTRYLPLGPRGRCRWSRSRLWTARTPAHN